MTTNVETTKVAVVPVMSRNYIITSVPATAPKGKQRQIVLTILSRENRPMSVTEVAAIWTAEFAHINQPVDGVLNSVRYHLHHLTKDGVTSIR